MSGSILIIDDDVSIGRVLSQFLNRNGYTTETATSGNRALGLLKENCYDLILCDYNLGDICGVKILEKVKEIWPKTIVIFISGVGDIPTAVNMVKGGAYQFLTKPLYPDLILETIEQALGESVASHKSSPCANEGPEQQSLDYIKGNSKTSQQLFHYVNLVAPTDYSVIIHGETGTGKEALAHFLHKGSHRGDRPFIAIDCGSLSRELAASELFGHKKGAFTGAQQDKKGAFESANGGTLFLDEISNLPYEVQMLLLRALQEKVIRRIGEVEERKVDVRVITASNESLQQMVHERQFREDLYHRLNEFTLEVPPLRERESDLPMFVETFIKEAAGHLGKKITGLSPEVWDLFYAYSWPGNIRELKNIIKRAFLLTPAGHFIDAQSLPLEITACVYDINDEVHGAKTNEATNTRSGLKDITQEAERARILRVLEEVNYNKTKAAALLAIDRKTLYNKLKNIGRST